MLLCDNNIYICYGPRDNNNKGIMNNEKRVLMHFNLQNSKVTTTSCKSLV